MDRLQHLADEFHLSVIEDVAQAIGARWGDETSRGRRAGSMGVSAAFSFYPTKNLSAHGDAGLVTTNNPEMAAHMRRLRNHRSPRRYVHEEFAWNSRLDAIQAAVQRVKLKYAEDGTMRGGSGRQPTIDSLPIWGKIEGSLEPSIRRWKLPRSRTSPRAGPAGWDLQS
jgi:dTDP-4-amino-4,6-dideoxygalactose transaminase